MGRECLPDGVLYCSKESHYSVMKAARMYRMEAKQVNTDETGAIDIAHLRQCLEVGKSQRKSAVLNINVGTTVKGAVDNLDAVLDTLHDLGYVCSDDLHKVNAGVTEESEKKLGFFIHVDGALFGLMLPFLNDLGISCPTVTFAKPIGSISVSGHKFLGTPVPCGVVVTKKQYISKVTSDVEYLNSKDATIMGSRNGHAALYLWYTLSTKGVNGLRREVEQCMKNANLMRNLLAESNIKCMLNTLSSTVVFERPEDHNFVRKWQLACEGPIAHAVVMPSVSEDKIRAFVTDLITSRAAFQK